MSDAANGHGAESSLRSRGTRLKLTLAAPGLAAFVAGCNDGGS